MNIVLNGQSHPIDNGTMLSALLQQLGLADKRLAVEINAEIVPRSAHDTTPLNEGDRVEIVHAIGGG